MRKYYVFMNNKYVVGTYIHNTIITNGDNFLYNETINTGMLFVECNTLEDATFIKLFIQGKIDEFEVKL